jgi:hypothetical protein
MTIPEVVKQSKEREQQLIDLLKKVMWQDYGDPDNHNPANDNCVFCYGQRRNGHRKTCEALILLSDEDL